ncbi:MULTISPECIES: hypothetical protein [Streptomyces]|uniref:Uncharacterized protein n=1 Tax=Streptomyces griseosporeus TaxID=1910 RepID=A0ABV3KU66_STRGS|nr:MULTISPECIES: hypothetical protein [Streptomyces]MBM4819602.1 hypothetical protein [Streptomyces actuosus]GHF88630.1 hypothetical protein GCM10018783_68960 [Streptomyces griseosporeus]
MGGVMKLGKALATGVAEEQPQTVDRGSDLSVGLPVDVDEIQEPSAPAPEEVPAAR